MLHTKSFNSLHKQLVLEFCNAAFLWIHLHEEVLILNLDPLHSICLWMPLLLHVLIQQYLQDSQMELWSMYWIRLWLIWTKKKKKTWKD